MWSKAKAFFKYGKRIEKSTSSNKSTSSEGASVLFDKMVNVDTVKIERDNALKLKKDKYTKTKVTNHKNNKKINKDKGKKEYSVPNNRKNKYNTANEKKQAAIRDNYKGPKCPYCDNHTIIKTAKEHIGKDENYCYWACPECSDVSVTTIKGGYAPAGVPANAETRRLRVDAHKYLYSKKSDLQFNNNALNKWISNQLSIGTNRAWIGQLDKKELINIILLRQNEIYEEKYMDIFNKID